MGKKPDFLVIGAPKAGTTWLFQNLRCHPDIWLPPYKSIQYFSGLARSARRKKLRVFFPEIVLRHRQDRRWQLRYFLSPVVNDRWYLSLFEPASGLLAGEVAPSYTTLTAAQVRHVKALLPEVKVIFVMRNPVDRVWSHALWQLVKRSGKSFERMAREDFIRHFDSPGSEDRTDYLRTMRHWSSCFGSDQVLVRFYDEIKEQPFVLLEELCRFLGVPYRREFFEDVALRKDFHRGTGQKIPAELRRYLITKYRPLLADLAAMYGTWPSLWLDEAERFLGGGDNG